MNRTGFFNKSIAYGLTVSAVLAGLLTVYFSQFTFAVLDDTSSGNLLLQEHILFLNYVFLFLHVSILGVALAAMGVFIFIRRARCPGGTCGEGRKMPAAAGVAAKVSGTLLAVSLVIAAAGYGWENKPFREYKERFLRSDKQSHTVKDINVILIVVDALRSDRLSCYGYGKKTSPCLDALAQQGILFRSCYSQASWTKPSVTSLLASLYPSVHGVTRWESIVPQEITTLPELMRTAGFVTYGCVANPCLKARFNYDQGFDYFDDYLMQDRIYFLALRLIREHTPFLREVFMRQFNFMAHDNIGVMNGRVIPWIEHNKNRNFFMYLHYIDTHFYDSLLPREMNRKGEMKARAAYNSRLYDDKVGLVDRHLGMLFEKLRSLGIYEKTFIIVTSDHGEAFGEHGNYYGGQTLYEEEIRVPLIMKYVPALPAGAVEETPVMSIDIMPTVLEAVSIPAPGFIDGKNIFPPAKERKRGFHEFIFSDDDMVKAVIWNEGTSRWKYIAIEKMNDAELAGFRGDPYMPAYIIERNGSRELYDLIVDPGEHNDRMGTAVESAGVCEKALEDYKRRCGMKRLPLVRGGLDEDTVYQLRRMGYFN